MVDAELELLAEGARIAYISPPNPDTGPGHDATWKELPEVTRANWRAAADFVRSSLRLKPPPADERAPLLARIAYEAYVVRAGGKSLVTGAPLPKWEEVGAEVQDAWTAATKAVLEA